MKLFISIGIAVCSFLSSCSAPTILPSATPESTLNPEPVILPLSVPGLYDVGFHSDIPFTDSSRSDRKVTITIWYPAIPPQDSTGNDPIKDATPNPVGSPYPVILSSAKVGSFFAPHLASYGFIIIGIQEQDSATNWGPWLVNYPLDLVFALNQVAAYPPEDLTDILDTEHVGAMGYSFDGYTSLALSGARVDPEFYLEQCSQADMLDPAPPEWWIDYICNLTGEWDAFVTNAGSSITTSSDGLWKPMTDERIRAVMPMAPEGAWLFGERGLAAADIPTLIIGATEDQYNYYDLEASYIYQHLGTPDRTLISFIDQDHMMIYDGSQAARMRHFATAFFGYYLQGNHDYLYYFSKDFVIQYHDLAWDVYAGE